MAEIDVTMSTIAVVSSNIPGRVSLNEGELSGILKRPFTIGDSPVGTLISSQRDQIEVIAGGNKLNVRDLSGTVDFSKSKIPEVLYYFKEKSIMDVTTYGINFIVTVTCSEPSVWIQNNILASNISERINKNIQGGSAVLNIEASSKTWKIKLEPEITGALSIDFNASETIEKLPDQNRLKDELHEQYDGLVQFLSDLGL